MIGKRLLVSPVTSHQSPGNGLPVAVLANTVKWPMAVVVAGDGRRAPRWQHLVMVMVRELGIIG
jgi:hypothetical protein